MVQLYNLISRRIADEAKRDTEVMKAIAEATKRDSLEMKGIALLTMTFLPATALASIFSMSSFFTLSTDDNRIILSPQFWIYWAITIPITLTILFGWAAWKYIATNRARASSKEHSMYSVFPMDTAHREHEPKFEGFEVASRPTSRRSAFVYVEGDPRLAPQPSPTASRDNFRLSRLTP